MNAMRRVSLRVAVSGLFGLAFVGVSGLPGCSPEGYESVKVDSTPAATPKPGNPKAKNAKDVEVSKADKNIMGGIPVKAKDR